MGSKFFNDKCRRLIKWYCAVGIGPNFPDFVKFLKMVLNKLQLEMPTWYVFHFDGLPFSITTRLFINELKMNGGFVHRVMDEYIICTNSFFGLRNFMVNFLPESKLMEPPDMENSGTGRIGSSFLMN
jgi:hypothetical protein